MKRVVVLRAVLGWDPDAYPTTIARIGEELQHLGVQMVVTYEYENTGGKETVHDSLMSEVEDDAYRRADAEAPTRDDLPKLADEKVSDVGGALLAGVFAGALLGATLKHAGEAVAKLPCTRCGRSYVDHKKDDGVCEGFKPKTYEPPKETP